MAEELPEEQTEMFEAQAPVSSDPPVEDEGPSSEDRVMELERELAAATARAESMTAAMDRMAARNPEPPPVPSTPSIPHPGDMPDPTMDPDKFKSWYAQDAAYRESQFESRLAQMQHSQQQESRGQQLWAGFQKAYPDYASMEQTARTAFTIAQENGLQYPRPGEEQVFYDAIAKQISSVASELGNGTASSAANRTAGVSGGSLPARQVAPLDSQKNEVYDFAEELRQLQSDGGLY